MMLECTESSPLQDEDSFLNLLKLHLLIDACAVNAFKTRNQAVKYDFTAES